MRILSVSAHREPVNGAMDPLMGESQQQRPTMKKRKQHYVWKHYLSAWATDNQLWCQRGDRRFRTNLDNIAQRRDFYRLKEMTEQDLEVIEALIITRTAPHLRALARDWIPRFRILHDLQREHRASGRDDPALDAMLDAAINDFEEDLHGSIEQVAVPLLAELRTGNASLLTDDQRFVDFIWFISMQYGRTPRFMRRGVEALSGLPGFNAEACWGLIRTILATTMGAGFMARRQFLILTFLEASSDAAFVAADQPIINTAAIALPEGADVAEVCLYYPLSSKLALLMDFYGEAARTEHRVLSAHEVRDHNRMIAAIAEEQVYAATESALEALETR